MPDRIFVVGPETGMLLGAILKAPTAVLDYGIDWTAWAKATGDTIASAAWTVPDGISVASGSEEVDGNIATVNLSGGTAGESYELACTITTSNGLTDVRSFEVKVEDR